MASAHICSNAHKSSPMQACISNTLRFLHLVVPHSQPSSTELKLNSPSAFANIHTPTCVCDPRSSVLRLQLLNSSFLPQRNKGHQRETPQLAATKSASPSTQVPSSPVRSWEVSPHLWCLFDLTSVHCSPPSQELTL